MKENIPDHSAPRDVGTSESQKAHTAMKTPPPNGAAPISAKRRMKSASSQPIHFIHHHAVCQGVCAYARSGFGFAELSGRTGAGPAATVATFASPKVSNTKRAVNEEALIALRAKKPCQPQPIDRPTYHPGECQTLRRIARDADGFEYIGRQSYRWYVQQESAPQKCFTDVISLPFVAFTHSLMLPGAQLPDSRIQVPSYGTCPQIIHSGLSLLHAPILGNI